MNNNTKHKGYSVHWFLTPNGKTQSYRFKKEEAAERVAKLLQQGFTEKPDPFRKGEYHATVSWTISN